jgi:hypothetical protein
MFAARLLSAAAAALLISLSAAAAQSAGGSGGSSGGTSACAAPRAGAGTLQRAPARSTSQARPTAPGTDGQPSPAATPLEGPSGVVPPARTGSTGAATPEAGSGRPGEPAGSAGLGPDRAGAATATDSAAAEEDRPGACENRAQASAGILNLVDQFLERITSGRLMAERASSGMVELQRATQRLNANDVSGACAVVANVRRRYGLAAD